VIGESLLGDFLKAQRERLRPTDFGLPVQNRRVPGLRREELARLAGISPDYYVRLEQGRQVPSEQVANALARVLRLDETATAYLFELTRPSTGPTAGHRTREAAGAALQALVDQWTTTPAWVSDIMANVIAANAQAVELSPQFRPGRNSLRDMFLEEERMREIWIDYEVAAEGGVASFRARTRSRLNDSTIVAYVDGLRRASPLFATMWSRQEVRFHAAGVVHRVRHRRLGEIDLRSESFTVNDTDGFIMTTLYSQADDASPRVLPR
jgi:transcriptional regulator with XRE-family HTH domain